MATRNKIDLGLREKLQQLHWVTSIKMDNMTHHAPQNNHII